MEIRSVYGFWWGGGYGGGRSSGHAGLLKYYDSCKFQFDSRQSCEDSHRINLQTVVLSYPTVSMGLPQSSTIPKESKEKKN
jgi:hypothetical protein